jgi:peptide/nickel transport system substrate-binding protein
MYHAYLAGGDCIDATNKWVRANGEKASFGWPNIPQVEAEVAAWFDARPTEEEKVAARRLNKAGLDHVVHAPIGFFLKHHAWRRKVIGVVQAPLPFFWGVGKAA